MPNATTARCTTRAALDWPQPPQFQAAPRPRQRLRNRVWLAWVCMACALALPAQAQRVALLIGNAGYAVGRLANPVNDMRRVATALKEVGFAVRTLEDADQAQMKRAVRDFGEAARGADIAFVYYAGHGTQVAGENYLIPLRATIDKESDYDIEALSANSILRQIAEARPRAAILVLDACRDNPLAATTRSTARGLARMEPPTDTLVAFATAPNTTAGDEGHFARALAEQIRTPGLELLDVFRNTTAEVRRASAGRQVPRVSELSITDRIYLAGPTRVTAAIAAPAPLPGGAPTPSALQSPGPSPAPAKLATTPGTRTVEGLEWMLPSSEPLISVFVEGKTRGVVFAGAAGSPVVAAAAGRVVYAGSALRGFGNLLMIAHSPSGTSNSFMTAYAHNDRLLVKEGDTVRIGQPVATMGSSDASQVQLHFEIRRGGKPVDPQAYLPTR